MNDKIDVNALVEPHDHEVPPEYVLWLAVIDRAMMDYVNTTKDLNIAQRKDLLWFFFERKPEPHNLRWICILLFGDVSPAKKIIARIKELKRLGGTVDGAYRIQHRHVRARKLPPLFLINN